MAPCWPHMLHQVFVKRAPNPKRGQPETYPNKLLPAGIFWARSPPRSTKVKPRRVFGVVGASLHGLLFWLCRGVTKSVQVLFHCIETIIVLTLIILKLRALA